MAISPAVLTLLLQASPCPAEAWLPHENQQERNRPMQAASQQSSADERLAVCQLHLNGLATAEHWRALAARQAAEGHLAQALDTISFAKARFQEDADVFLAYANILYWNGKVALSEEAALSLAATHPDYPGLRDLLSNIRREKSDPAFKIERLSFHQAAAYAAFPTKSETWLSSQFAALARIDGDKLLAVAVQREDRGRTDTRFEATTAKTWADRTIQAFGSITPDADFRERWSLGMRGVESLGPRMRANWDIRYADYGSEAVTIAQAGMTRELAPDLTSTFRTIHLFGGGENYRLGVALRGDLTVNEAQSLFALVATYPDIEGGVTRRLNSIAIGATGKLTDTFALQIIAERDTRDQSYERSAITFGLIFNL